MRTLIFGATLLVSATATALAQAPMVQADHAWARPTSASTNTGAVYLTPESILSPGKVYLVVVSSTISDDQAFPNPGGTLGQNFYTSFQVNGPGGGAGQPPGGPGGV